jgi:hypothetical protein
LESVIEAQIIWTKAKLLLESEQETRRTSEKIEHGNVSDTVTERERKIWRPAKKGEAIKVHFHGARASFHGICFPRQHRGKMQKRSLQRVCD